MPLPPSYLFRSQECSTEPDARVLRSTEALTLDDNGRWLLRRRRGRLCGQEGSPEGQAASVRRLQRRAPREHVAAAAAAATRGSCMIVLLEYSSDCEIQEQLDVGRSPGGSSGQRRTGAPACAAGASAAGRVRPGASPVYVLEQLHRLGNCSGVRMDLGVF